MTAVIHGRAHQKIPPRGLLLTTSISKSRKAPSTLSLARTAPEKNHCHQILMNLIPASQARPKSSHRFCKIRANPTPRSVRLPKIRKS